MQVLRICRMTMASTGSTFASQWKYDVFLSFRGEDTGKTFTDHLYTALDENGFYAFRDDEKHEKGEEIAPEFLRAIEESKISILVFSKNYASSRWCLHELETIIKYMKKPGRMVMPVFYHVDPSEVRNQTGSCGESFLNHERDANEEEVKRWREALRKASNLVGWHLQNQYESQLIKEIITDILRRLNCEFLQLDYDTVGMEFHFKKLLSLINLKLDKVLMIGINGISGIGKTTVAKSIYNKISYHFQRTIFLRGHQFNQIQFQLLLDDASIGTHGRAKNERVLLVVDDVDRLSQVENLVTLRDSFSLRSRIIFTTSDRNLLNVDKLDASYEAKRLTHEEAIQLFSWHAFKQTFPKEDYATSDRNLLNVAKLEAKGLTHEEAIQLFSCHAFKQAFPNKDYVLVNKVVDYAEGHPLALKVLGSSLFGKTRTEWECILQKLEKDTNAGIYNALKVGFDELTPTEQEIFLKVVCLLKGKDEESVSTILDSLELGSESGIQVLHDMCLATISNDKLYMHDLLQQMGQKLIDENNPHEPSKRSRLQDSKDVYPRLTRNTGTEEIQKIQFGSAGFPKMPKLYSLMHRPLISLPPNFPGDSLILHDLSRSNIRQLWEEQNKILGNLKVMNLSYCQNLVKISKFSSMPALKTLTLKGCRRLRSHAKRIWELECLEVKRLSPPSKLEYVDAHDWTPLETFSIPSMSPWKRQSRPSVFNDHKTKIQESESRICLPCPENDPPSWVSTGFDIVIPGSPGIPEWKSCQRGCEVKIELPMNWYEHKGFLGFVLCSVYIPLNAPSGHESEDEFENSPVHATHTWHLKCKLIDQIGEVDFLAFGPTLCECYFNGGPSKQMWLSYYPKVALKKKYFSNEWSRLIASFEGYHSDTPLEVKECGVHLIYARSDQHDNLLPESLDDAGPIVVESDSFDVGQQPCLEG